MKTLNKTWPIGIIFIFLIISACSDDFLSVPPKGSLGEQTLANEQGINGLLMAAYNPLNGCAGGTSIWGNKNTLSSMPSDEAYVGTLGGSGTIALTHFYRHDASTDHIYERWEFYNEAIQRANDVLRFLNKENRGEISAEREQQLRAEARFLRGVYHLEFIMFYGNIPYVDETITFANNNYLVGNEESAWSHIEEDFQYASDNLTDTKSDPGRANSYAAKAYLVKTYMHQAKFSEAQPLLQDIIANGVTAGGQRYDLHDQYHWNFDEAHKNGPESVFAAQTSVTESVANAMNCAEPGNGPYGGGAAAWGWLQPSFDFANSFKVDEDTGLPLIETYDETPIKHSHGIPSTEAFTPHEGPLDARIDWSLSRRGIPLLDWGINPGMSWVRDYTVGGPFFSMKHLNWASNPGAREGQYTAVQHNLIRFADVLLWAAEVEVEIGSLSQAEMYVNRVRERAANPDGFLKKYDDPNDPQGGFSDEPAANYKVGLYDGQFMQNSQEWAREAVRFERKLELGLEHHRFHDLQRYDLVNDGYMAEILNDFLEDNLRYPHLDKSYFRADDEFTEDKNEYYPIPQEAMDLSVDPETGEPSLIQNPGY